MDEKREKEAEHNQAFGSRIDSQLLRERCENVLILL